MKSNVSTAECNDSNCFYTVTMNRCLVMRETDIFHPESADLYSSHRGDIYMRYSKKKSQTQLNVN